MSRDCLELRARGAQYLKIEEADRVYVFLAGLNPKFDGVRSRILGQRLTPSLREVCSEIWLKEDRSCAMNNPITTTDAAAFIAKSPSADSDKNPPLVCEHCKKPWHTKDQCWKLHGRPPNSRRLQSHDKSNIGRALVSDSADEHTQKQSFVDSKNSLSMVGVSAIAQSGSEIGDDDWHCSAR
ncbi:uncharacterized protein LOC120091823 [Benincasa hispida]|uniref:uncharacterized protein LOC120091823 n=1 Tax=Benincasa hispida TaxID=102211 RepID=UPI0019024534|nr:uncharacterized protein LOC120091823 [Benincasa hispida]